MRSSFLLLLVLAVSSLRAAEPSPLRTALLAWEAVPARPDVQRVAGDLVALAQAELSAEPGIAWVEREELDKLLAETELAASDRLDPRASLRVGKLARAQLLVTGRLDNAELWPSTCADKEHWRERVDAHLARKGDINYRAETWTPLLKAIEAGNLDLVRYLIERGADPRIHPFTSYDFTIGNWYSGSIYSRTMRPADMSMSEFEEYIAALIRILEPLEPREPAIGFTDCEDLLSLAARQKYWPEVEAYVAAASPPRRRSKPSVRIPISRRKSGPTR